MGMQVVVEKSRKRLKDSQMLCEPRKDVTGTRSSGTESGTNHGRREKLKWGSVLAFLSLETILIVTLLDVVLWCVCVLSLIHI